jgi:hypothetical protein
MASFKTRKKYRLEPFMFGLPLPIALTFGAISIGTILFLLLLSLFDISIFILIGIGIVIIYSLKMGLNHMVEKDINPLKFLFPQRNIKVIKNNSLKPFKLNDN